ncbi:EamA family transporter [Jeongeupia chitinilytica]|uniref:O-acetylserine/cysteine exporter n=1 Tax=Jeongeupia chitinilytica TaxID=1041641 RepID=A0ABQ3GZ09_9NEIS|nr:EamA family transporter [Jeongeupia chitinilytica]GHD62133.1 O-acetylserine/cysteine exporter [Jeongeupia chitinilytica]
MALKDWLAALLVIVAWGVNFVVIKVGLHGVPPMLLGALRFMLVAFPAVLFVPRPQVPWTRLLAYGATISLGQFVFLFSAIDAGMPAGLASLVLQAQAFFTVLLAAALFGERMHWYSLAGLAVAAAGLAMIGLSGGAGRVSALGFGLTLCAALCWAGGNLVIKGIGKVDPLGLVVWGALVPPLPFLALSLWLEGAPRITASLASPGVDSVLAVFYLAYVATCLGYGLWGRLLAHHPVRQIAPLTLLVPVVGLLSARLLLGEQLTPVQWAGGLVVMLGLLVNVFGPRWRAAPQTA